MSKWVFSRGQFLVLYYFCYILTICPLVWIQMQNSLQMHKQPSRGVLRKSCSKNMQKLYRRTPMLKCDFNKVPLQLMLKCDFNKVALQLCWNHTWVWVFSCKLAAYFQNTFSLRTPLDGCFCRWLNTVSYFYTLLFS